MRPPDTAARYREPALQRRVYCAPAAIGRPERPATARGLVRGETGYVRTARPYGHRRPVAVRPRWHRRHPAPRPRSRHRLRCRLDAATGPGPIGSARPNPPSCQRRSPPGARPAHAPVRTGASRLPGHAERSQLPGKTGSARCCCAARCSSPVSFIRSIRPTRSKTLAAVRLSADNDLGKHAADDLTQTVALIRVLRVGGSGSGASRSGARAGRSVFRRGPGSPVRTGQEPASANPCSGGEPVGSGGGPSGPSSGGSSGSLLRSSPAAARSMPSCSSASRTSRYARACGYPFRASTPISRRTRAGAGWPAGGRQPRTPPGSRAVATSCSGSRRATAAWMSSGRHAPLPQLGARAPGRTGPGRGAGTPPRRSRTWRRRSA